jgi:maltose O-acetyltransferase
MKTSEIINTLMFDFADLSETQVKNLSSGLPSKILRWLGAQHPDNKTRKIFLEMSNVSIGEGAVVNRNLIISDGYEKMVKIGERVAISPNVTIICESGPNNSRLAEISEVQAKQICFKPVEIGNDSWIGANVTILPGVKIGSFCIIGAGAVVTRSVEDYSIAAGNPAKLIKKIRHGLK